MRFTDVRKKLLRGLATSSIYNIRSQLKLLLIFNDKGKFRLIREFTVIQCDFQPLLALQVFKDYQGVYQMR
jgi:hypothetical protein